MIMAYALHNMQTTSSALSFASCQDDQAAQRQHAHALALQSESPDTEFQALPTQHMSKTYAKSSITCHSCCSCVTSTPTATNPFVCMGWSHKSALLRQACTRVYVCSYLAQTTSVWWYWHRDAHLPSSSSEPMLSWSYSTSSNT